MGPISLSPGQTADAVAAILLLVVGVVLILLLWKSSE